MHEHCGKSHFSHSRYLSFPEIWMWEGSAALLAKASYSLRPSVNPNAFSKLFFSTPMGDSFIRLDLLNTVVRLKAKAYYFLVKKQVPVSKLSLPMTLTDEIKLLDSIRKNKLELEFGEYEKAIEAKLLKMPVKALLILYSENKISLFRHLLSIGYPAIIQKYELDGVIKRIGTSNQKNAVVFLKIIQERGVDLIRWQFKEKVYSNLLRKLRLMRSIKFKLQIFLFQNWPRQAL